MVLEYRVQLKTVECLWLSMKRYKLGNNKGYSAWVIGGNNKGYGEGDFNNCGDFLNREY